MHEVGIMASALDAVRQQAALHHATSVSRIVLRIGQLASVDIESLRFAFEAMAPGTIAASAILEVECVAPRAHCATCQAVFSADDGAFILQCPTCGTYSADIRAGRELGIARLEFSSHEPHGNQPPPARN